MNLELWIGKTFDEEHVFELIRTRCCDRDHPHHAKFCLECGKPLVASTGPLVSRPEWEDQCVATIYPVEKNLPYSEKVFLDDHITAQWFFTGTGQSLVVGMYMGGVNDSSGESGPEQVLMLTRDDDNDRFKWRFKAVNRWLRATFPGKDYQAGIVVWASTVVIMMMLPGGSNDQS